VHHVEPHAVVEREAMDQDGEWALADCVHGKFRWLAAIRCTGQNRARFDH
jgi:hypothetical protein